MNGVLLLAGPPAVGHNTVAANLASSDSPVAVADGDDLRAMVNHPAAPGSGPEWESQYDVCVRNLCAIASNFDRAGLATILLDVVEPETVPLYRELLAGVSRFDLVLLIAEDETLLARDRGRHPDAGAEPRASRRGTSGSHSYAPNSRPAPTSMTTGSTAPGRVRSRPRKPYAQPSAEQIRTCVPAWRCTAFTWPGTVVQIGDGAQLASAVWI